jgi:hypothetical protein
MKSPTVQFKFILVIHGIVETSLGGKLDDSFTLTRGVIIGVGDVTSRPEVVLQILKKKQKNNFNFSKNIKFFNRQCSMANIVGLSKIIVIDNQN